MARLEAQVYIGAPPQQVWDFIADIEGQQRWMVDVRRMAVTSDKKSGAGTVVDLTSELFGLPLVHDLMEITTWDPPSRFEVAHRGRFTGTGAFELQPWKDGTVFYWWEDFHPPLGPLGELAFAVVVRPHMRRVFKRSLANLKQLVESSET